MTCITVLLEVVLLNCLHKDLCIVLLLCNLIVVKLLHFLCEACAVDYYLVNGEALVSSTQGFVQWVTVVQSGCGKALVLFARGLCCGDDLEFSVHGFAQ